MSNNHLTSQGNSLRALNAAPNLSPQARKQLAIKAVAGTSTITKLSLDTNTSRKFIYAQKQKAEESLNEAFAESISDDKQILFHLPVTKSWLKQLTISLILVCHSSYQGVVEIFRDVFDFSISKGTIHNIVHGILNQALYINRNQNLSQVKVGAHDEIFQAGCPVLVGCDAVSTYCYLLSEEKYRDGNTWGTHLLDLRKRQKLTPHHSIADGGAGLRKGQADAWPDIPCHGDVFHALKPFLELTIYLENRAFRALSMKASIEKKLARPRRLTEHKKHKALQKQLNAAEQESQKALTLADNVRILYQWVKGDILSLIGSTYLERQGLLDFIIEELIIFEPLCLHKIQPVRKFLQNHRTNLLAFVREIDNGILAIAKEFQIDPLYARSLYELQGIPFSNQSRWEQESRLRKILKGKFYPVELEIKQILSDTIRASSVVENVNSRLRNYFTLRRMLGKEYLTILQFFLNHRRFMRSKHPMRVGKSPRELMTGQSHPHWLELLGFELFKRAA